MTSRTEASGARQPRRAFFRGVAGFAAAGTAIGASAPAIQEPAAEKKPDAFRAEVDARMGILLARYGDRLDDKARESIRRDIESNVRRARRLREYALTNGDGPALILVAYRAPEA